MTMNGKQVMTIEFECVDLPDSTSPKYANLRLGIQKEKEEVKKIFSAPTKTPDGRPVENLNKPNDGPTLSWDEDEPATPKTNTPSNSTTEPSQTDIKRKKAFEDLKKKLTTKPQ